MRRGLIKVIATLGPSSGSEYVVRHIASLGVSGFRINFSHGNPESWDAYLSAVAATEDRLELHLSVMGDLEGPRIRTANNDEIKLERGQLLTLGYEEGDVPVGARELFEVIEPGDIILADDGKIVFQVEQVDGFRARVRVIEGGVLSPRKGLVVAGKEVEMPPVTRKDKSALRFLAERKMFSHVMVSYARSPEHVELIRSLLRRFGRKDVRILAKIESPSGVRKAKEIADASDGIVVARGDLGMHYPLDELPMVVEEIVDASRRAYRPVIMATEFLQSMLERPIPTRSEIVDIHRAVALGSDALLLTSETAVGKHPVRAVHWMLRASSKALSHLYSKGWRPPTPELRGSLYKLARGLVELAESLDASLVVYSRTGRLVHRLSLFKPSKPIYVGVPNESVERGIRHLWGAQPYVVEAKNYEEGLQKTVQLLVREGVIGEDELVVEAAWSRDDNIYLVRVRNIIV